MFYAKPSTGAASCDDTAPLSLPAPSAPDQGDGEPNPARTLGWWNDETLAEVAQATVALDAAWPPNHPADDIQQIEQADSEQTADEWSIEIPTFAPARSWVKPLAVWAPGWPRSVVRQRNAKSVLAAGAGATGIALAMRLDEPPEKRGVVLVTAELMGDPKPNYVRAELRQDEGRSAPVGQDD
jgi:hypothetical protein